MIEEVNIKFAVSPFVNPSLVIHSAKLLMPGESPRTCLIKLLDHQVPP